MRCSVLYIDHTAMGGNNGTAQGQPKTQPAAAIAAGFAKGIKHIKQLIPAFFRDAGAVIRYADADKFTSGAAKSSMRECSGVYLMALLMRFTSTCSISWASISAISRSSATLVTMVWRAAS